MTGMARSPSRLVGYDDSPLLRRAHLGPYRLYPHRIDLPERSDPENKNTLSPARCSQRNRSSPVKSKRGKNGSRVHKVRRSCDLRVTGGLPSQHRADRHTGICGNAFSPIVEACAYDLDEATLPVYDEGAVVDRHHFTKLVALHLGER